MSKRATYDPNGPTCFWCGNNVGQNNPARTWYPGVQGAMTPVCGPDCEGKPADAMVFNYHPRGRYGGGPR